MQQHIGREAYKREDERHAMKDFRNEMRALVAKEREANTTANFPEEFDASILGEREMRIWEEFQNGTFTEEKLIEYRKDATDPINAAAGRRLNEKRRYGEAAAENKPAWAGAITKRSFVAYIINQIDPGWWGSGMSLSDWKRSQQKEKGRAAGAGT